jgi:hypothetical protein
MEHALSISEPLRNAEGSGIGFDGASLLWASMAHRFIGALSASVSTAGALHIDRSGEWYSRKVMPTIKLYLSCFYLHAFYCHSSANRTGCGLL